MGWQEKLAAALSSAAAAASKNEDAIQRGIDKAAKVADEKTGSKYSEQIRKGSDGLRSSVKKLGESGGGSGTTKR
jgi:hypothetical protein